MHKVLVNRLGGLSLARTSVVRLTDHPDMTLEQMFTVDVKQQHNNNLVNGYTNRGNNSTILVSFQLGTTLSPRSKFFPLTGFKINSSK